MITFGALLLVVATSQTSESIYADSFDAGAACPASISTPEGVYTRALVSDIKYPPANLVRHNVDLTQFENIWGHITPTDFVIPWPGVTGATVTLASIPKDQYIAAAFRVPAGAPVDLGGYFSNDGYNAGPPIDISISKQCGDFSPPQRGCHDENQPPNDSHSLDWRMQNPTNYVCALTADTDYYVNIKFHDPQTTHPGCSGNVCRTTLMHQWSVQLQ
jgi:hypothetical protein